MAKKPTAAAQHHCGRCGDAFSTRQALQQHLADHPDAKPAAVTCIVCKWAFEGSLDLERHAIITGHSQTISRSPQLKCDRCSQAFATKREYNKHRKLGQPCCDAYHSIDWQKTPRPVYDDLDKPKVVAREGHELEYGGNSSGTPSDLSTGHEYCHYCKKAFTSAFAYTRHLLGCIASNNKLNLDSLPDTPPTSERKKPLMSMVSDPQHPVMTVQPHSALSDDVHIDSMRVASLHSRQQASTYAPAPAVQPTLVSTSTNTGDYVCNVSRCQRTYKTAAGLKLHQTDNHGIGGQALDMYGKDSWMLSQRERERLKAQGLLQSSLRPTRGGSCSYGAVRDGRSAPPPSSGHAVLLPASFAKPVAAQKPNYQLDKGACIIPPSNLPACQNAGGALDMEQAKAVCGKMLRLLLQSDVLVGHYGKVSVSGIDWTRVGIERQSTVIGLFDEMCHLPRSLQGVEYLPVPKTFLTEYTATYSVAEFQSAPARDPAKPRLGIVAMACSKVKLDDGREEIVKLAAIDVLTCRILMSHLVCTNADAPVAHWNSSTTGFTSYRDMEYARKAGYKILKGWPAARTALFRFVDENTIIVGHNLRSDLDALRIVHGRAVDIVKIVEKAAKGPLSKSQVSLDSWCRDVADVAILPTDPVYGRDCVLNAFAAREIGLWAIKNRDKFEKVSRQRTKEFQSVTKT